MAAYLKFPSQGEDELYDLDGKLMEYDFGGEADLLIDIAGGPDDFAFRALNKKFLGEMK